MKLYLKYICASFLILLSGMAAAQNHVTVDVDYSVDMTDHTELTGSALITFQGNSFKMSGNGIEVYCDGDSVWTLDMVAKEVYIESVTPESIEYMNELEPKLVSLKDGSETSFISPEGETVHVKVKTIKKSDGKSTVSFRPTYDFDSSWVVTDMR